MSNHDNRHDLLDRVLQLSDGPFSHELARHILNLHIPAADQARYEELSARAQDGTLKPQEQTELDDYLNLNDFLILLKAKSEASLAALEDESTPVDDVRRVRERISREAGGDIRKMAEEANRIVEMYREKLNLKIVKPPHHGDHRTET